jgi:hypothetical protein
LGAAGARNSSVAAVDRSAPIDAGGSAAITAGTTDRVTLAADAPATAPTAAN